LPENTQPFFLRAGLKAERYLGLAVLVVIGFVIWRW
jgi:hypothetical protein